MLYLRESTLWAQDFNTSRLELAGEPRKIAEHVGSTRALGYFSSSQNALVHRNGAGDLGQLAWLNRNGERIGSVGRPFVWDSQPVLSADGSRLALSKFDGEHVNVWIHDLARDLSQKITFDPALNASPIWSPDGTRIAFSSGRAGHYDLYQIGAGGSGEKLLYASAEDKYASCWSGDGRFLLYSAQHAIWALPLEKTSAGSPIRLTSGKSNQNDAVLSPDSKWLAYASDESGTAEVYFQPFSISIPAGGPLDESKTLISRGGGTRPRWRADGRELVYRAPDGMLMSVPTAPSVPLNPGVPKNLFRMTGSRWDLSSDGSRFLIGLPLDEATQSFTTVLNWQGKK